MSRIIAGYCEVVIGDITYEIRDHSFTQEHDARIYSKKILGEISDDGLTEAARLEILQERNIWNGRLDAEMHGLINHQKVLLDEIKKSEFKSKQKQRLLATLEANKRRVSELSDIENRLSAVTVENFARIEKYKRILYWCTYVNGERCWKTWDQFEREDAAIVTRLVNEAFFNRQCGEKEIRDIARSEPWRSLWKSSTGRDSLFGKPVVQYSSMQRELAYWSLVYDSVFESSECPADDVIQNDDLLDAWFADQADKRKTKGKSTEVKNDKIANAQAVGIFVDSPEDAEKVYNLNDPITKGKIKQREQFIAAKGKVAEEMLPEAQQEMRMQMNKLAAQNAKRK